MQIVTTLRTERGIALPTALFVLVVVGALVAGIFFTGRVEVRSGENTMSGARASEAAQAGLMMGYPTVITLMSGQSNGATIGVAKTQIGTTGSYYQDSVTQLNKFMYLVRSFGTYEVNGTVVASRTMAMLVKKFFPELGVNAGAIVVGDATVTGSASLDGHDQSPPGWSSCPAGADMPGLRASGTTGGNKLGTVQGSTPPTVASDPTVPTLASVMDTLFYSLANQANVFPTGSPTGPGAMLNGLACNKNSVTGSWGDPTRSVTPGVCESYFPIVYLNPGIGNSVTVHGDGQGVLLVNGDLKFNATTHWVGLILVRGSFLGGNGTADIDGALVSSNVDLDPSTFSGNLDIDYSSCAVNTAFANLSVTSPATYRGFIQY